MVGNLKIVMETVEIASPKVKLKSTAATERVEPPASSTAPLLGFWVQRVDPTVKLFTFFCKKKSG